MSLSVVIPTKGRPTLARTLFALQPQLHDDDEVVVVGAAHEYARKPGFLSDRRIRFHVETPQGGFGDSERNIGMALASGTHLCFIDDDDEHTPGALDALRANQILDQPVIFKMEHPELGVIWRKPVLEAGNVSSQMILAPNVPSKLDIFAADPPSARTGDWEFIRRTCGMYGCWSFVDHIVVRCHREPE